MALAQLSPGLEAAGRAFSLAWQAQPAERYSGWYCFAGRSVAVRVVGRTLGEYLCRPFAHLAAEPPGDRPPKLTIEMWDRAIAGLPYTEAPVAQGADRSWEAAGGVFATYGAGRVARFFRPGGATWLDRGAGRIVGWRDSAAGLSTDERTKPLPLILAAWYHDCNVQVIHAGLVARDGRGVLVGGQAGSGKSTTALACALDGFDFLGDDHVGLESASEGWLGRSLYNGARVEPRHLANFPELSPGAIASQDPNDDKFLIFLAENQQARVTQAAAICAIVLPRLNGAAQTQLRPASRADVVRRIGPSSLIVVMSAGAPGLRQLAQLASDVPAYWLDLGPQVREIPQHIEAVLAQAR
jgi:hypothetical protein